MYLEKGIHLTFSPWDSKASHMSSSKAGSRKFPQEGKDPGMDDTGAKLPRLDECGRGPEMQGLLVP